MFFCLSFIDYKKITYYLQDKENYMCTVSCNLAINYTLWLRVGFNLVGNGPKWLAQC